MIRILLADDHRLFRQSLAQVLDLDPELRLVAWVASTQELLEAVRRNKPDLVILDLNMPGRGGIEAIDDLQKLHPETRILVLTALPEDPFALRCLKAGAHGFLTKKRTAHDLLRAIHLVADGKAFISDNVAQLLAAGLTQEKMKPSHDDLTTREFRILWLLAQGGTPVTIAEELALTRQTIGRYLGKMQNKLEVDSVADLVRIARASNLAEYPSDFSSQDSSDD